MLLQKSFHRVSHPSTILILLWNMYLFSAMLNSSYQKYGFRTQLYSLRWRQSQKIVIPWLPEVVWLDISMSTIKWTQRPSPLSHIYRPICISWACLDGEPVLSGTTFEQQEYEMWNVFQIYEKFHLPDSKTIFNACCDTIATHARVENFKTTVVAIRKIWNFE